MEPDRSSSKPSRLALDSEEILACVDYEVISLVLTEREEHDIENLKQPRQDHRATSIADDLRVDSLWRGHRISVTMIYDIDGVPATVRRG